LKPARSDAQIDCRIRVRQADNLAGAPEIGPQIGRKRDEEPERAQAAVDAAIEFVAMRSEGPARILMLHYPLSNGICAGCTASATRYPCLAARIAELARLHPTVR
jgi:hypothetical protein